jgi:hypothetical protein
MFQPQIALGIKTDRLHGKDPFLDDQDTRYLAITVHSNLELNSLHFCQTRAQQYNAVRGNSATVCQVL